MFFSISSYLRKVAVTTLATEPRCLSQISCAFLRSPAARASLMLATNLANEPLPKAERRAKKRSILKASTVNNSV